MNRVFKFPKIEEEKENKNKNKERYEKYKKSYEEYRKKYKNMKLKCEICDKDISYLNYKTHKIKIHSELDSESSESSESV